VPQVRPTESAHRIEGNSRKRECRLYYYRARYYDPAVGRFLSEDPATKVASKNRYSYVSGRPIDYIDPLGLFSLNISEIKTAVTAPWWDFTNWGFGRTDFSEKLDVKCVSVECGGWQRRITLSAKFHVFYSSEDVLKHELRRF
jgi:RHS repeat-associated protein